MQDIQGLKKISLKIMILLSMLVFIAAAIFYHKQSVMRIKREIEQTVTVVTPFLWNYDQGYATYLAMAAKANNYEIIEIRDNNGSVFGRVKGVEPPWYEKWLTKARLIHVYEFHRKIEYSQKTIGTLIVFWRCRSVYVFMTMAVFAAMIATGVWLSAQLRRTNTRLKNQNKELIHEALERKAAEKKIKHSLEEKDILLREIHHRVKNNMQIIQSLLSLQSHEVQDEEYKKLLVDSNNRIRSMALIHETLYRSDSLSGLNLQVYFNEIVNYLLKIYRRPDVEVVSHIDVPQFNLDIDLCIACGLIINELVSNALKYAFGQSTCGNLSISLNKADDNQGTLVIQDDGCGLPENFNIETSESLGLKIVRILVQGQLNGSLVINRDQGTAFIITFPLFRSL